MKDELLHQIWRLIFKTFRQKRFATFLDRIRPLPNERILDIGGYMATWEEQKSCALEIHLVNIHEVEQSATPGPFRFAVADGCALPYSNASFDVIFSNSVIEHVGDWERQKAFAAEARRVGGRLWVQTPAQEFWIEPHFMTPFIHWFSVPWRVRLARNFTIWGWLSRPSDREVHNFVNDIRLLRYNEMLELFPDCEILRERTLFGLLTKSYIAVRS